MYGHTWRPQRGGVRGGGGWGSESARALERIERAVVKSQTDILAKGENVSAWKVSQAALLTLQAYSWDSLGFPMQQVPSLFRIMVIEGKVNSFIHCFVGVQRITTLYDLEVAICDSEGVRRFEELELGPLLQHPLVQHYFSVGSDVAEVFKITTQEVISYLGLLIWRNKNITPDDLLDFISKRKKQVKETLCLRIQSLGMHIRHIMNVRRSEKASIMKCLDGLEVKYENKDFVHDEDGDDDEHEDSMDVRSSGKTSPENLNMDKNNVQCSGLITAEENAWVGSLSSRGSISTNDNNATAKKPESLRFTIASFHETPITMPDGSRVLPGFFCENMDSGFRYKKEVDGFTRMFIKIWTDTCRDKNVDEVFEEMVDYYSKKKKKNTKKKRGNSKFSKYPYVGLLNVAIASIKFGMWNSTSEASQASSRQGVENTTPENHAGYATQEVEAAKHTSLGQNGVFVEDILKNISAHLGTVDEFLDNENPALQKLIFFRKLYKCECWLAEQLSVKDFESLGFGDFCTFLAKHVTLLPHACQKYLLTDGTNGKPSFEACMSQHHLGIFLSQASASLSENECLSKQKVSEFLMMQFPSVCFTLLGNGSAQNTLDIMRDSKTGTGSSTVLFSATLTAHHDEKCLSDSHLTAKDALEVLCSAPMLIDLNSWSFWDLKFAPSLGPLVNWLLNEVKTKELLCLITKGGKVLRLDHSATVESFLEVFVKGSSFQTAVKLLSLLALYGGEHKVPTSLLKCHADKALEILVKSSTEGNVGKKYLFSEITKSKSEFNKAIPLVSRFILECLGYLPEEFRTFAANLLLPGFRAIAPDASSAILAECKHKEDRLMLHELGSSLAILEWIGDCSNFCLSLSSESSDFHGEKDTSCSFTCPEDEVILSVDADRHNVEFKQDQAMANRAEVSDCSSSSDCIQHLSGLQREKDSTIVIESIRREEFGLDTNLSASESSILQKQHARLGRALHCLSQELYSQDSHFLLELVQNADDNVYPRNVEPTLSFILLEEGIVVLNNEQGFSTENIRALCDVGNSTKKGSNAGYIGKKGIGFKSVFRVTDAPEIHSNGFHIKFDKSEGEIGFVLPTIVPACDVDLFSNLVTKDTDQNDRHFWNTCIVLPFRSKFTEASATDNIVSMFSDLHPSLLLFLHRLQCIMFRNMLTNSCNIMRKEVIGDGIINISFGKEKLTWFVESRKLQAALTRHDAQMTEISIAFALEESTDGNYTPKMEQQCVFAFLPLRTYGLKFIIQGDFILPSSREEVDGDSPWNQWLLSEFPNLFISTEKSFCSLPCFENNPGKGVSAFMSFVPLVGEVHGFFSSLPRIIISKLCTSNCLLLEGDNNTWVPPHKVLRSWNEQVRTLLPDSLIAELLGLGYLHKDIILSDSLARALGIEEYGPKILLQVISSLCHTDGGIKSMGLTWLSSFLSALYEMSFQDSRQSSVDFGTDSDAINRLRKIPFIPLLNGKYGSISEGTIWLNIDAMSSKMDNEYGLEAFPNLFAELRIVDPTLFSCSIVGNLCQMLYKVGVQRLSAHEIVTVHVLPAISDEKLISENKGLMCEYLSYIMVHLQSSCPKCSVERQQIISEVHNKALILTNHGYKRLSEVPIHFNKKFGNPIDVEKLINGIDVKWFEVEIIYLKYPVHKSRGMPKWRKFLKEVGVTDFVQAFQVEKTVVNISHVSEKEMFSPESTIKDWESQELVHLLSRVCSSGDRERCKHLLQVIDTLWDDYFSDKVTALCNIKGKLKPFKSSSLVSILNDFKWVASSVDDELHYPGDLFHDCEAVRSILGDCAPYAVPKVQNEKLPNHIGFKTRVTLGDTLSVLEVWRRSGTPFKASISQISNFYTIIWKGMATKKQEIVENLSSGAFVFVPFSSPSTTEQVVPGVLLSPKEVYWHDNTGSVDQIKIIRPKKDFDAVHQPLTKMLSNIYPDLHDLFVNDCGVNENPSLLGYVQILLELSTVTTPSQAAKSVFRVFLEWSDGLKSGILNSSDVECLKVTLERKDSTILPTSQDKWVSLHSSFGIVCWCNDEEMANEFEGLNIIDFLHLCELSDDEKETIHAKVSVVMQRLGIPSLSELITREAICYGAADSSSKTSLVSWALPYAQRYIYNAHPDRYFQLKLSGFENLNRLRIVVVEKLFFRKVIKRSKIASKQRFECNCLLQGDMLYTTPESDSHSIFMELSSFLLEGIPQLHLANFLHMITTMVESGSSNEKIEIFISNSQKMPKLPSEESVWSLQSTLGPTDNEVTPTSPRVSRMTDERRSGSKSRRKSGTNQNWPPVNWTTAPKLGSSTANVSNIQTLRWQQKGHAENTAKQTNVSSSSCESNMDAVESENVSADVVTESNDPNCELSNVTIREKLFFGMTNGRQAFSTGRKGEMVAFKHLSSKVGEKEVVKWVNEVKESGLPYDIVVGGDEEGGGEYIEVKATDSTKKDWFEISVGEWKFAVEKGESFSIAHVALLGEDKAKITMYRNPVRLCRLGQLQLAVVMVHQQKDASITHA
ncbi:hypothetical protein ABFS82_14G173500 [Erythranthe guttata]